MPPSPRYSVRRLTPQEVQYWLSTLRRLANSSSYTEGLERADLNLVFGAFDQRGHLVAFASLRRYSGYWYLRSCVVDSAHRGYGLQRRLIRARVNHVRAHFARADRVNAWVSHRNRWSRANLEAEGFARVPGDDTNGHSKMRIWLD